MDRLVQTSLSALRGAMARQATTANNLANVDTVGFRGEMASARALWIRGGGLESRALASEEVTGADFRGGAVTETARPLDVALEGDALLAVQAENGEEAYTRRGDLQLSETGLLTTGEGTPVLGDEGPITLPPADSVKIERDGAIWIVPTDGDPNAPQLAGRLKLASPIGSQVVKGIDGLFRVQGGGILPGDATAHLLSGRLEGSNVEATKALTDMIEASRAWDTQLKLITTARDLDSSSTDLMRMPD
ncbi:MAG: flagellar basal body rod protein FlgF [Sphingomonadales bacterium]